jgi:hypothetical protein
MRASMIGLCLLGACSGDDDGTEGDETPAYVGCGSETLPQIFAGDPADLVIPDGQEGALEDVLIGVWQHTWAYEPGTAQELLAISDDDTNIRFAIPDLETFIYCQDVSVDADGVNESSLSLDGNKLVISGPGYTATAWTADRMVWRNDYFENRDSYYILDRLD